MSPLPANIRIFWGARLLSILLITVLLLGSQSVQTAQAATITVDTLVDENDGDCSDGDCSLRDAIETAIAGDTIEFSVTGTIILGGTELTINKNLTINGPGASSLSISGAGTSRVFGITTSATVTIHGLTVTNGREIYGGGISTLGTLTLTNCVISGNTADNGGGGIKIWANTVTINNSIISDNTSYASGGGILLQGGDSLTVNNSTISGNEAVNFGGGIDNSQGTVTLINSTVSGNTAGLSGGGIFNGQGWIIITNSTISGNSAANSGGGIGISEGATGLNHCTITDNTADSDSDIVGAGGGIYSSGTALVIFRNTLIVGNSNLGGTGNEDCWQLGGTYTSLDYNLAGDGTGCSLGGAHDQTTADAMLRPLADNGGDTETHALDDGSPALNQIPDGTNGCGTTYTEDQRGVSRPQGTDCDIGSFEGEGGFFIYLPMVIRGE